MRPFFLMHLHNVSFHMIVWLEFFIAHGALHRFYLSFMKFSDMGLHRVFIRKTFLTNRTFMCNSLMDWADMFLQRCFPLKLFSTKIAQMAWIKDLLRSERNTYLMKIIMGWPQGDPICTLEVSGVDQIIVSSKTLRQEIYLSHCAKVQKYEQGKIGLQFFDMWC